MRVQRWSSAVETAVPRDWEVRIMLDKGSERLRWLFSMCGGGVTPVRKLRMASASVISPSSVGVPVLSPKPR